MRKVFLFFLVQIFVILSCTWMEENQVALLTGIEAYDRGSVIFRFRMASLVLMEKCPQAAPALEYMMAEGYDNFFSEAFYKKESVEACLILLLVAECPLDTGTANSISYYKNLIYHCKVSPVDPLK